MSLMKRMLSSIGIGSAKVDTELHGERFAPGENLTATVRITGGDVEQHVDAIYFSVHARYPIERNDETVTETTELGRTQLAEPFTLAPGEQRELPVVLRVPLDTPLTLGGVKVWVQTGLDIKQALDPGDKDAIQVVPDLLMQGLFDTLAGLGFRLVKTDCEPAPSGLRGRRFVQEFEFKPAGGPFQGRLDELEVVCLPEDDRLGVLLEVDRKARGLGGLLAEMMNMDESRLNLSIGPHDLVDLDHRLRELIERAA